MKLLSVNRSLPQNIEWQGKTIATGIFKIPVTDAVMITADGLYGDDQADLSVHGGIDKAVYLFPHEHHAYFADLLGRPVTDFNYGQFGENLSTQGLLESETMIGDRFRIGDTAEFEVSQPREPCFKLGIALQAPQILRPFLKSLKTGFYLRVLTAGTIQSGDPLKQIHHAKNSLSVAQITRLRYFDQENHHQRQQAANLPALTQSWRESFGSN
ncbi:MAG: MOSC domain-containing protein [Verrucomicrobiales bacterium]|nr:MOSC domain-containing protein [Verrucomicrobiales bacterium]